ncbi:MULTISPECIES: 5'-nucleotidase [unclassified Polaromonas]|uniref:5'-nucleotidase n=1 Tax=unclassified Polaromonas TaxID=2638319 RepID=UPI000F08C19C|nr:MULTISPECIES: 5'-nucleotidase [unclassified Polaromonas]AYQ26912.1 5'-nucleotidase [Polaromonas sp. SP1]QGJ18240.1 5'-nucleotidase [Polaromonas sp. Pch-P]
MPYPIEKKLVIAVSSRAVFDMDEANSVFEEQGVEAYRRFQLLHLNTPFNRGVAFPFIRRLLRLNELYPEQHPVEVVVLSRNSPDTGQRFFRSCQHYGLSITRGAFLSGESPHLYIGAFNASLFLSANRGDVVDAILRGFPAGLVMPTKSEDDETDHELRIAFDFDGVLANDEAERIYAKENKLEHFHSHEVTHATTPHDPGPLKDLFTKIGFFQKLEAKRSLEEASYVPALRVAIVTARNAPANERMVTTLREWGFEAAELFLMGGIEKKRVLDVLKPHIFFDDQITHLEGTAMTTPSVLIPFGIRNEDLSKSVMPDADALTM